METFPLQQLSTGYLLQLQTPVLISGNTSKSQKYRNQILQIRSSHNSIKSLQCLSLYIKDLKLKGVDIDMEKEKVGGEEIL